MKSIKCFLAVISIASMTISACTDGKSSAASTQSSQAVKYTCPMHHQIIEEKPGSCPICGMTLVKISGQASQGAGISLNAVLQPVNSSVISNVKAISPVEKDIATTIKAQGYLDFDTRTFNNIAARFSGRIEKLYIKSAFQEIQKGQRIFDIYSPEVVTAQQDLLYLVSHSATETEMINAARQKLILLGMTAGQLNQLINTRKPFYSLPVYSPYNGHVHDVAHSQMAGLPEAKPEENYMNNAPLAVREGMYVTKGQNIFNVVDPHSLWAIIKVSRTDIAGLKLNQPVQLSFPDLPGMVMDGKVNFIEPLFRDGDKTITIRVYIHNMDHHLKVNSLVTATIKTGQIKGLWIPRSALLNLGQTTIVWLKDVNLYKAHRVSVSTIDGNEILITYGLTATDVLAENAQYLTDSESFIKIKGNENQ